ncbi:uncharacterized protein LOC110272015 [Arachis ipaensis]|uniref:uncharacterized protein LOC110272015 n=1 Tax=Arachis ipaensis TaxID=130454 RepID=UPI000A2B4E0E|nr:uncharacterized protein LOC110272015 [Arachis ipaensis]
MGVQCPKRGEAINVNPKDVSARYPDNPFPVTLYTHPALPKAPEYKGKLPYPQKLQKAKKNKQFAKFLEREAEIVVLTKECSAIIQKNLLKKLQDPGSFIIPCTIGNTCIKKVLHDLGASINLMPLSLLRKLQIQEIKPTRIYLQLADYSVKFPVGVVEDMLMRVGPFSFPVDFVILDMEEDKNASIILGRPFLATGRTIIDVQKGKVTLRVNDEEVVLNAVEAMQHPNPPEEYMRIDAIEPLVEKVFEAETPEEELDTILENILPELDEP